MKYNFPPTFYLLLLSFFFSRIAGAQSTSISTTSGSFVSNATYGMVTFNFRNDNIYPVRVTGVESVSGLTGTYIASLYYNATPINGMPAAITLANGWNLVCSSQLNAVSNTSSFNKTTQPFISNCGFIVPPKTTYGFVLSTNQNSLLREYTIPVAGVFEFSSMGCSIICGDNISYGTTGIPPSMPGVGSVGFVGKINVEPVPYGVNNAGCVEIEEFSPICGSGLQAVRVRLANFGRNRLDSMVVSWSVDGIAQSSFLVRANLDTIQNLFGNKTDTLFNLGQYLFQSNKPSKILISLSSPNGQSDSYPFNDTITAVRRPMFSGNYSVGGAFSDYQTLAEIANDISRIGICGPVTIQVNPGTYSGRVCFNAVPGAGPANPISIIGSGKANCILNDSIGDALFSAVNTGYLSIRNMAVLNRFSGNCSGISIVGNLLNNKGTGCSIVNCKVNLFYNVNVSNGILISGSILTNTENRLDSITIDSNEVIGGLNGIFLYGYNGGNSSYNRGHRIRNNRVMNCFNNGINIHYIYTSVLVSGNSISMNPSVINNSNGINIYYNVNQNASSSSKITNNSIEFSPQNGIYLNMCSSTSTAPFNISNNKVCSLGYGNSNGIIISSSVAGTYHVLQNTVQITALGTQQYGFYYSNSSNVNGILCKNNIFAILSTTGNNYCAYFASGPTTNSINYNIYWNQSGNNLLFRGSNYTATNFKTILGGGDSSYCKKPGTFSSGNLKLNQGCDRGVNLQSYVPDDFDGIPRPGIPNIGAHEYSTNPNNLSVEAILNSTISPSQGSQNLVVRVRNAGSNALTSFTLNYVLNNAAPVSVVWNGNLGACDTLLVTFSGVNALLINPGVNNLMVYSSFPNGMSDAQKENDSVSTAIYFYAPLSGNYSLGGPTANFKTFEEASIALRNFGVSGPVNFYINPGIYTEQVIINGPIPGGSAGNRIQFNGLNANQTILNPSVADAALKINQASYITINNLRIVNSWFGPCAGVSVIGNNTNSTSTSCVVKNCRISVPNSGYSASYGIILTGHISSLIEAPQKVDSLTLDSNFISDASYGIFLTSGTTGNVSNNRGHIVRKNVVEGFYLFGFSANYIFNPVTVIRNSFRTSKGVNNTGINFSNNRHTAFQPTRINENTIVAGSGIYFTTFSNTNATNEIYNNMITGTGGLLISGITVIKGTQSGGLVNILHNSVNMIQNINNYGLNYDNSLALNSLIQNNIFRTSGVNSFPLYMTSGISAGNLDFNNYFNSAVGGNLCYRSGNTFSVSNFQTSTSGGSNSISVKPQFLNDYDLHLFSSCFRGTSTLFYTTIDNDGASRFSLPVIGAHEAAGYAVNIGIDAFSFSGPIVAGANNINLLIRNHTSNPVYNFVLKVSVNNGPWVTTFCNGYVNGCDTATFVAYNSIPLISGYNLVQALVVNPNGIPDGYPANDTIQFGISSHSYAPGNALSGNGSNSHIRVPHRSDFNFSTNLSIEAWVNISDPARNQVILSKTKTLGTDRGFVISLSSGKLLSQIWDNQGVLFSQLTGMNFPVGKWTHIAITWAPGFDNYKTYINGIMVNSSNPSSNALSNNLSELAIGAASYDYTTQYLNGYIDEVRFWNITLDELSIRKNMHRMMPPSTQGLVAYFQMNEPTTSNSIYDCRNYFIGQRYGASTNMSSSVPAGGDSCLITPAITNGSFALKNFSVTMVNGFGTPVDLVINEVPFSPNVLPSSVLRPLTGKYWIVNPVNSSGNYLANISFTLDPGQLSSADTTLRLFGRNATEHGPWQLLKIVGPGGVVGNTITFTGVPSFGQFTLATNSLSTLPVRLLQFRGERVGDMVQLNWVTSSDSETDWFDIERRNQDGNFISIGRIKWEKVHSAGRVKYEFTDKFPPNGIAMYKLKMTDNDGSISYSPKITISGNEAYSELKVFPNPFTDKIEIEMPGAGLEQFSIFDVYGNERYSGTLDFSTNAELELNLLTNTGVYFLHLGNGQVKMLIKK